VEVWHILSRRVVHTLCGKVKGLAAYRSSAGKPCIATVDDSRLIFRDGDSFAILHELPSVEALGGDVGPLHIAYSRSAGQSLPRVIVMPSAPGGQVKVLDGDTLALLTTLHGPDGARVTAVASYVRMAAPGHPREVLVVGDSCGVLRIFDLMTGERCHACQGNDSAIRKLLCLQHGETTLVVAAGDKVNIWDGEDGRLLQTLDPSSREVDCLLAWRAPTGHACLATGGSRLELLAGFIDIWDIETGSRLRTLKQEVPLSSLAAFTLSEGQRLVTGSPVGRGLMLWDANTGFVLESVPAETTRPGRGALDVKDVTCEDGRLRGIGRDDCGGLLVWDLGDAPSGPRVSAKTMAESRRS
jgi:WD40 repeat protein